MNTEPKWLRNNDLEAERIVLNVQAATAIPRFTDPVLKVLHHRLRTHLLSRLSATTSAERVRAASSANENLTSIGLGELSQHVAAMVDVLERVRRVDWEAHGFVYEGLVGEVMVGEG